jgi:mono/diheme cytochrome c family protein
MKSICGPLFNAVLRSALIARFSRPGDGLRLLRFVGPILVAAILMVSIDWMNAQSVAPASIPAKSGAGSQAAASKSAEAPSGNAENGKKLYLRYGCYECHGTQAHGVTPGPGLGPNAIPFDAFRAYLRHPTGEMPPYTDKVVSDQECADIYAFIRSVPRPPDAKTIPLLQSDIFQELNSYPQRNFSQQPSGFAQGFAQSGGQSNFGLPTQRYARGGEGTPTDYDAKTEWAFGRLVYSNIGDVGPPIPYRHLRHWSEDWPYADWHFAEGVQRLTRIDARHAGETVDLTSDEIFNWPWIYGNQVGNWSLPDDQAKRLREYLLKGGFLLVDNFHDDQAWQNFMAGIRKVFPDRPIEELQAGDEIYHTLYDIDERMQVPGSEYEQTGKTYVTYVPDGIEPHWRAIRDDRGRVVVAISHNMHLGDSWEHADDPLYPERFTSFAYRVGMDYLIYSMTH